MNAPADKAKYTPGTWHVNAIKTGRIVGDETAETFDKLQIHAANCTVATVYRSRDARLIAAAPALLEFVRAWLETQPGPEYLKYRPVEELRDMARDALKQAG